MRDGIVRVEIFDGADDGGVELCRIALKPGGASIQLVTDDGKGNELITRRRLPRNDIERCPFDGVEEPPHQLFTDRDDLVARLDALDHLGFERRRRRVACSGEDRDDDGGDHEVGSRWHHGERG